MTKILYFSGTGNSLWTAKKIGEILHESGGSECDLLNIGTEARKSSHTIEADAIVLVIPSYAYGLPLAVKRFVRKAVFKTPYIAVLVTYGSNPGGTPAAMARILKRKKINAVYYGRIPAVENYTALLGPQKEKTIRRRLALQREATEEAARCIIERHVNNVNTFRPFSAFVSALFTLGLKIFYRRYRVSPACNGCGICAKMCPVTAVAMRDKRPVFSRECEHCQGCLHWCPQKAIHFGRMNVGAPQYHHPEISLAEMLSQVEKHL